MTEGMGGDEYLAQLERHILRAREQINDLMGLIEDSNHRVGRLQKLCLELLNMLTEIAPAQVASRRQVLMSLANSSRESDQDFSRFLFQILGDGK